MAPQVAADSLAAMLNFSDRELSINQRVVVLRALKARSVLP